MLSFSPIFFGVVVLVSGALSQNTSGFTGSQDPAAPTVTATVVHNETTSRAPDQHPKRAVAVLSGPNSAIKGVVVFDQGHPGLPVRISGNITGLQPNSLHGFHVHKSGDLRNGCASAGAHYNPGNATHGAPTDTIRHVGDLGNVLVDAHGVVTISLVDTLLRLGGKDCIIGRAVVLHEKIDDLGQGTNADSKQTGNAGGRLACGVIGYANMDI